MSNLLFLTRLAHSGTAPGWADQIARDESELTCERRSTPPALPAMRGICNGSQTDRSPLVEVLYTSIRRSYPYTRKFHNEQIRINVISSCQRLPDAMS